MALRWIHLSDFHFDGKDPYDRNTVLNALITEIHRRREHEGFQADVVFITGDIAYSGQANEYKTASAFFDALLVAAGLDKTRLFIAPGNHDVDKSIAAGGLARTLKSENESVEYFASDKPKYHFNKFTAFKKWFDGYFKKTRSCPKDNTCHPLQRFEVDGHSIAVLAINSALFSLPDGKDHNALWIGRRNLDTAVEELERTKTDLNFVLMHHPLDWLNDAERGNVKAALQQHADFVLRGHLHQNEVDSLVNPQGNCFHIAAGACYQTREYPNTALFCTVEFETGQLEILPLQYVDSSRPKWVLDTSLFDAPDYIGRFMLPAPRNNKQSAFIHLVTPAPMAVNEGNNEHSNKESDSNNMIHDSVPQTKKPGDSEISIDDVDPELLAMVIAILEQSDSAAEQLAKDFGKTYNTIADCRQTVAHTAVTTKLFQLVKLAGHCQAALRIEQPPDPVAVDVIARFLAMIFPAQDSARTQWHKSEARQDWNDQSFQLLVGHATLAEIRMAALDKRPVQFDFNSKESHFGKGLLGEDRQPDGESEFGRDPDWLQFEKEVKNFLFEKLETHFAEEWRKVTSKTFREYFEERKKKHSFEEDEHFKMMINQVLEAKSNAMADEITNNSRIRCEKFTYYFLIKTPLWMTQDEITRQDAALQRLKVLFSGIAFLRLSPPSEETELNMLPFVNLHKLLNPNE